MDDAIRSQAEVYARLASLVTLDELGTPQRATVEQAVVTQLLPWLGDDDAVRAFLRKGREVARRHGKAAPRARTVAQFRAIAAPTAVAEAHRLAREWVYALLKGTSVTPGEKDLPAVQWLLKDGQVLETATGGDARFWIAPQLLQLIRARPFPFRLCPACDAVFVRARRQRFCSVACTARMAAANDAARERRRTYMRDLMRKRRRRAREAREAGSRPGASASATG